MVVAAWRSSTGASFALLERLANDAFQIAVSVPLVLEYEAVLLRHLDAGRRKSDVVDLVDYFCTIGVRQEIFFLWRPLLRDPNDDMVAELAVAAGAAAIVTHNVRDFGGVDRFGIQALTPGEFLRQL
jgi:predicted nucleic acid-binding protein